MNLKINFRFFNKESLLKSTKYAIKIEWIILIETQNLKVLKPLKKVSNLKYGHNFWYIFKLQ